jgi:hypothetical protein
LGAGRAIESSRGKNAVENDESSHLSREYDMKDHHITDQACPADWLFARATYRTEAPARTMA